MSRIVVANLSPHASLPATLACTVVVGRAAPHDARPNSPFSLLCCWRSGATLQCGALSLESIVFKRLLPLLIVFPIFAAEPEKAPRSGELVYRTYCGSCHGGGWQGAPVAYDKVEWEARMANGFESLLANAKKGMNAMPPMGACMDCSDEELADAIKEMLRF